MSLNPKETPGRVRDAGASDNSVATTDTAKPSRAGRHFTQTDRVLRFLIGQVEVCGSELYGAGIHRSSVAIHHLRQRGYVITKKPCDRPDHHHEGTGWLYRLDAFPHSPGGGHA